MSDRAGGPLHGIRVIDVGTRISAPFCAGLLGELGADVIKVELPGEGDFMRTMGPFVPVEDGPDYSLSWSVEGRGRRGVTCDLRHPEGKELFKRLVASADVLCENFRPGTMERWGLGPDDLPEDLVYVRISVFGQSGPYAPRPGLDRLGIAFGGLLHLTGDPDRPPVRPGVTISDYLTGTFAAFAAVAALYGRDASVDGSGRTGAGAGTGTGTGAGTGEVIDAPLYGAILRVLEWTLAGYDRLGIVRQREGNRLSHSAPLDNYPSADGSFVCIVAGSDANFSRLCAAMDRADLLTDPRFATLAERAAHGDEINGIVAAWTSSLAADEITARCVEHDVPVGTAYSAADIFADPHMAARGDLVPVEDHVIGTVRQQAPFPRLTKNPGTPPVGAPRLGEHNAEVWCGLVGLSEAELDDLHARGVV
ncbi:MAG TPA: CaiB/BaiF CoA-transferase family protein [Acidimicrobiales bacterium]|jgi:crotonobetainyl-CoA:carnitine CoA-transferase CaiB-like acyl-CoA transferase|nr:CaiB/BaiF CoA-transferase family protein [Acidimicrobiales bacterium]